MGADDFRQRMGVSKYDRKLKVRDFSVHGKAFIPYGYLTDIVLIDGIFKNDRGLNFDITNVYVFAKQYFLWGNSINR